MKDLSNTFFSFIHQRRDSQGRDLVLLIIIFIFLFCGFTVLFPISSVVGIKIHDDPNYYIKKQSIALCLGLVAFVFAASISFEWLYRHATILFLISLFLLVLVFVPGIGRNVQTSQGDFSRWLNLGFLSIQPSEFAKISLINYLSASVIKLHRYPNSFAMRQLLGPSVMISTMLLLIVLEPQYGTMFCMLMSCLAILYVSGFSLWRMFAMSSVFTPVLLLLVVFSSYRFTRISVWLDPFRYRYEGGYQLVTSYLAYKNSGFFGKDLSTGFAHRYLTFGHTDFVLPLFAENFGLFGIIVLLGCYLIFVWKIFRLLNQVDDGFIYLFSSGIFAIFMIQSLINMLMTIGILPTTGISLPFFSFGGSSLVSSLIIMGLLFNMSRFSQIQPYGRTA